MSSIGWIPACAGMTVAAKVSIMNYVNINNGRHGRSLHSRFCDDNEDNEMNQLLKHMLLVCVCLFALTGQAMADSLSDAKLAYDAGDYEKAAKLYSPLAKKGNAEAQYNLGVMYRAGRGVPRDPKEAGRWYRLAAEQGNALAQFNLGWLYASGKGVPQDYVQSLMWFNIAIANADGEALKEFIVDRDSIAKSMTAKQIAKAQELAKKCTAKKFKGC